MVKMENIAEDPFHNILRAESDYFNNRFKLAQSACPDISAEDFLSHLDVTVRPIINELSSIDYKKSVSVTARLYDFSLELVSKDLAGPSCRIQEINQAWTLLLPLGYHLTFASPVEYVRIITNAIVTLHRFKSTLPDLWIEKMVSVLPWCKTTSDFMNYGRVAAWYIGLAQYRENALKVWDALPDEGIRELLDIPEQNDLDVIYKEFKKNIWFHPGGGKTGRGKSGFIKQGGFRGYGGLFITLPRVALYNNSIYAGDEENTYAVFCDAFGASCVRVKHELPENQYSVTGNEPVIKDNPNYSSIAFDGSLYAMTLETSHFIYLSV